MARPARKAAVAAAALAIGALATGAYLAGRRAAAPALPVFEPLTFRRGFVFSARFSPDGKRVYYGASWEGEPAKVFVASLDGRERRALDLPPADVFGVTPSGDFLLGLGRRFRWAWITEASLAMGPEGAAPRALSGPGVRSADLSPDGSRVALARMEERETVLELPPGKVLVRKPSGWIGPLAILPGDRGVAFTDHPVWGDWRGWLALAALDGSTRRLVEKDFEVLSGVAVGPGGREVWFSASDVGIHADVRAVSLSSGAVRSLLRAPGALRLLDVSADGRVLVALEDHRRTAALRRASGEEVSLSFGYDTQVVAVATGGREVLMASFGEDASPNGATYLRRTDGSPPVLLGDGEAADLSPDGAWAVALRHGEIGTLALLPTAGGEARTFVLPHVERNHWARFTRDGKALIVSANETGRKIRLYRLDLATGESHPVTPEGVGYLLALTSAGDGVTSVDVDRKNKVFPFDGGPPRELPGVGPGEDVCLWLQGDREFLVMNPSDVPIRVFRVDARTGERRPHYSVGPSDRAGARTVSPIAFDPTGDVVAYNVPRLLSQLFVVSGIR